MSSRITLLALLLICCCALTGAAATDPSAGLPAAAPAAAAAAPSAAPAPALLKPVKSMSKATDRSPAPILLSSCSAACQTAYFQCEAGCAGDHSCILNCNNDWYCCDESCLGYYCD